MRTDEIPEDLLDFFFPLSIANSDPRRIALFEIDRQIWMEEALAIEAEVYLEELKNKQDFIKFAKELEEEGKYFEREGRLWYLWRLFEDWKQEPDCCEGLEEFQKEYKLTLLLGELDRKSTVTNLRHGLTIEDLENMEYEELTFSIFKSVDPGFSSYPYNELTGSSLEEYEKFEGYERIAKYEGYVGYEKNEKYEEYTDIDSQIPF